MSASRSFIQSSLYRQALRFLVAGGLNTFLTLAVYQILLFWFSYPLSFTIAFLLGIIFTGFIYTRFVFTVQTTPHRFILNALYYLLSYTVSLFILDTIIRWMSINERIAMVLTVGCMVPVNFLFLRVILTR